MKKISFSKMQALGNDFMVIDGVTQSISLTPALISKWANRKRGIGFDQLLLVEPAPNSEFDFTYRIFNADGSEVAQCGNGARCVAYFVFLKKLSLKNKCRFKTARGEIETERLEEGDVRVNMGAPKFALEDIPAVVSVDSSDCPPPVKGELEGVFKLEKDSSHYSQLQTLPNPPLTGRELILHLISMGNPHAVLFVEDVASAPVEQIGTALQNDPCFPEQVNVGFVHILDLHHMKLRVYERGVGETEACGSGACAAVVAGIAEGLLNETVTVELPGGILEVSWKGGGHPVFLKGAAELVYEGSVVIAQSA